MNADLNINDKKDKKKKKKKHRHNSDDDGDNDDKYKKKIKAEVIVDKTKSIEQLRAERLKREAEERAKAERLLNGNKSVPNPKEHVELDDRKRRYNSQFNPDLARH